MQENQVKVLNNAPIKVANTLPPHRIASCKNYWVEGMSHNEILSDVKERLNRTKSCFTNCWFNDLTNELVYRGVVAGQYSENNALIPSLEEWESAYGKLAENPYSKEAQQGQGRHLKKT